MTLSAAPRDALGMDWSHELYHPIVLEREPKFKGAVWDVTHTSCRPDGVVVFHSSPFSNYAPCGSGVRLCYREKEYCFPTSEAIIMAFKERLLAGGDLGDIFAGQAVKRAGGASKQAANKATRRANDWTWWRHHGMHVLVGAVACLPKFAQDDGLRRFLLSTQQAVLIEAAPSDGAWGVGSHSAAFLVQADPTHFTLHSEEQSMLRYETRDGCVVERPRCEANALGKALMVVRELLRSPVYGEASTHLRELLGSVCAKCEELKVPFDWQAACTFLMTEAFPESK